MFVKKFEGATLDEALSRVKMELGPNALVIATDQRQASFWQKPVFEVTAAFNKNAPQTSDPRTDDIDLDAVFPHRRLRNAVGPDSSNSVLRYEARRTVSKPRPLPSFEALEKLGLSKPGAVELREAIQNDTALVTKTSQDMEKVIIQKMGELLGTLDLKELYPPSSWMVVGVGGAGKTTVLVKMALALKELRESVRFYSTDNRKVVGKSELSIYARLLGLEFGQERSPSRGIQFIDTAALCLSEPANVSTPRLGRWKIVLVVDGCSRLKEMQRIVDYCRPFKPNTLVFTRLDLATEYGALFDIQRFSGIPVLGGSFSGSFSTPFCFFDTNSLSNLIVRGRK